MGKTYDIDPVTKCPRTKLSQLHELMDAGDWKGALRLAASFGRLGGHDKVIRQAWEAAVHPDWCRGLGKKADGGAAYCATVGGGYDPVPRDGRWRRVRSRRGPCGAQWERR